MSGQKTDVPTPGDRRRGTATPPETLPESVHSPRAKLVLLWLYVQGESTVEELVDALGQTRLTIYPVLNTLAESGHVDRDGAVYAPR
jgi:DNA-binding MarR family transcriptional regulator